MFIFLCVWVLSACMLCALHLCLVPLEIRRGCHSWKLEWWMLAGSRLIQVLWKNNKCLWPVSHLSGPFLELISSSMSTVCLSVFLYSAVFCITPVSFTCYVLPCFYWFYHFPLIGYISSWLVFALSYIILYVLYNTLCRFVSLIKTFQLAFCWTDVVFYLFTFKHFLKSFCLGHNSFRGSK